MRLGMRLGIPLMDLRGNGGDRLRVITRFGGLYTTSRLQDVGYKTPDRIMQGIVGDRSKCRMQEYILPPQPLGPLFRSQRITGRASRAVNVLCRVKLHIRLKEFEETMVKHARQRSLVGFV